MRQGGVEIIKDGVNNADLKIEWLKIPGGTHGGSWAARVSGKPLRRGMVACLVHFPWFLTIILIDRPLRISMMYYFGLEGLGSLDWNSDQNDNVSSRALTRN